MLNVSLIGAGFIGRVHAQCIAANPGTRLAAVHDLDASAAAALAERRGARVAGSVGEIVGGDDTDAVVIASSTDSHGEIARALMEPCLRSRGPVPVVVDDAEEPERLRRFVAQLVGLQRTDAGDVHR